MQYKKIMILAILLVSLLAVSTVSAEDNATSDIVGVESQEDTVIAEVNDDLASDADDDILSTNPKTFTDLNAIINDNENRDVYLDSDYKYNPDSDSDFEWGIGVNRAVTVHGNGFTIDGANNARIFSISNNEVVLKDIIFVNAKSAGDGGAVICGNDYCVIANCSFVNCSAFSGGAIRFSTDGEDWTVQDVIANCSFVNCSATHYGGAVICIGDDCVIANCSFVNCSAYFGGAVSLSGDDCVLANCSFVNCFANYGGAVDQGFSQYCVLANCSFVNCSANYGGAVRWSDYDEEWTSDFGVLANCSFVNCSSNYDGGAIYLSSSYCHLTNSNFADCSAARYGGAIYLSSNYCHLTNSNFVDCSASSGGAVYLYGDYEVDYIFYGEIERIYYYGLSCTLFNCSFVNCSATNKGCVYWSGDEGVLSNCTFVNCSVLNRSIIYWSGDDGVLSNCSFINCNPDVEVNLAKITLSNCYKDEGYILINLIDILGNPITDSEVIMTLGDAMYTGVTDEKGIVRFYPVGFSLGWNTVTVFYEGSDRYDPMNRTYTILIKTYMVISASYDVNHREIVANLTRGDTGTVIRDANVNVNIDGVDYRVKSDSKGQIKFSIYNLTSGNYTATISYEGNSKYDSSSTNVSVVVTEEDICIFVEDTNVVYKDVSGELVATLTNANGEVIIGADVDVDIDGVDYSVKSDSNGQIKFSTSSLNPGKHTATISYGGNNSYNPITVVVDVFVAKANSTIAVNNNKVVYRDVSGELVATLTNANGDVIIGADVDVDIDGVDYRVKSDSNGQIKVSTASLLETSWYHKATISYAGNNEYNPSEITTWIKVSKADTCISADNVSVVYGDEDGELIATLTNIYGNVLNSANVVVSLNGVDYALKTNSKGQVKVSTANLLLGTYNVTISYAGNTKYNPSSTTAKVTVFLDIPTFTDLNRVINGNNDTDVYLNSNYIFNSTTDSAFKDCIVVNRPVTIHGNGFTIDGANNARIFSVSNNKVVFENIIFVNGKTTGNGGAIKGVCSAVNCIFVNNSAKFGGALSSCAAVNCTFINNHASEGGGAISYAKAVDCDFIGNSAGYGGALYGSASSAVNCNFTDNSANKGGAISGGSAVNCTFTCNTANEMGGALYGSKCSAINCIFTNNSVGLDPDEYTFGGAMFGGSCVNCTFAGNSANYGGAICDGSAENCAFIDNSAWAGGAVHGGSCVNCTFTQCSSYDGGAIYNCDAVNCNFVNNYASFRGGAMCGGSAVNCTFVNNSAEGGGAVDSGSAVNCTFIGNSAEYGGAIYNCDAVNCNFVNNYASFRGGAMCGGSAVNCTFVNNSAEFGGAMSDGSAVNCTFINDDVYNVDTENCTFITYVETVITANDLTTFYGVSENLVATLKDVYGNLLAGEEISIVLNNMEYALTTNSKGQVSLAIPTNLAPGTYVATITYAGNVAYDSSTATANVVVQKADTSISAVYNNAASEIVATLTNANTGKVLNSANLLVSINGETYTLKTNSKGQVKVSTVDLAPGVYTATVSYKGNSKYNPSSIDVIVNTKFDTNISMAYDKSAGELVATLTNAEGKALNSANVIITINGETYALKTNSRGQVKVSMADQPLGKYTATASYKGNAKYNPSYASIDFDTKANVIISDVYDDSGELVATFTNADTGKAVSGANVKVNINGVTTTVKTNSKGKIKVSTADLEVSDYTAVISYAGNAKYNPASATVKIDLNKTNVAISAVYDVNNSEVVATLINSATGKAVHGANVIVELNGVSTTIKSDSKGQVIMPVGDLDSGTYVAVISYKGNAKYNPISTTANVVI